MSYTLAQQLDSVQTAIAAIESGAQSITVNGRVYTRADLKTLYDREERIRKNIAAGVNGGSAGPLRTLAQL
jgi:hypothetical protein